LKESSSTVNDSLGAFYIIRPRVDRHHALIEGTPQWGRGECSYPRVLPLGTNTIKERYNLFISIPTILNAALKIDTSEEQDISCGNNITGTKRNGYHTN